MLPNLPTLRLLWRWISRFVVVVSVLLVWLLTYGRYQQREMDREERRYLRSSYENWSTSAAEIRSPERNFKPLTFYKTIPRKEAKP